MALIDTPDVKQGFWLMIGILLAVFAVSMAMSLYKRARSGS